MLGSTGSESQTYCSLFGANRAITLLNSMDQNKGSWQRVSILTESALVCAVALVVFGSCWPGIVASQGQPFRLEETTIEAVHNAYKAGQLTSRQLVQLYLKRIDAY